MTLRTMGRFLPIVQWLPRYRRADLSADALAGLIVAIMLVPQGMAYALLAGMPPETGLYASIVPLILYGLLGSSRALAVGPVAIVSLMVASAVGGLAETGSDAYLAAALLLALLSGVLLIAMGAARLGFLVNFISHPVISGFISAAALVIAFSQLKYLLGLDIPRSHLITDTLAFAVRHMGDINWVTAAISVAAIALLVYWGPVTNAVLGRMGIGQTTCVAVSRASPLAAVLVSTVVVWAFRFDLSAGVRIVGDIPAGLPPLTMPPLDGALWLDLLPAAALITIVGFLESVSIAKALASKRRQKIDANQELVALGVANLGAAFTGAYPVAGGFGRSMVNFTAGAVTPIASIVTAILIALSILVFTPLFYFLPTAVLSAVIVVAVARLVDVATLRHAWVYNKADAASLIATFFAVLSLGVEIGIVTGIGLSLVLYLYRTSKPHVAIVGRVGTSEHFRNILRHQVRTCPHVLAMRIDESLYFANTNYLEDYLLAKVADDRRIKHVVLICSAINFIDTSALESLFRVISELKDAGVTLHLAEVKGPVMDRLKKTELLDHLLPGKVFLSTHEAMTDLDCV